MELNEIKEKINSLLIDDMEMDPETIREDAHLVQEIGMTSLDFVDAKAFIRREFHFTPEALDMRGLKTLNDLYDYIYERQVEA